MNSKWEGYRTTLKVINISIKSHLSKKAINNKIKDIVLEYSINNHKKIQTTFLSEMMSSNKKQKTSYQPSNLIYRILQRDKETDSVFYSFFYFIQRYPYFPSLSLRNYSFIALSQISQCILEHHLFYYLFSLASNFIVLNIALKLNNKINIHEPSQQSHRIFHLSTNFVAILHLTQGK